jgi:vacuolar-type H+-ATPase subunit C/Vma6
VPLYLLKEIEFIEQELSSDHMEYLLADWRWDDFKTVLQSLMVDMERLQKLVTV